MADSLEPLISTKAKRTEEGLAEIYALVAAVVRGMVDGREAVTLRVIPGEKTIMLEMRVAKNNLGKVNRKEWPNGPGAPNYPAGDGDSIRAAIGIELRDP